MEAGKISKRFIFGKSIFIVLVSVLAVVLLFAGCGHHHKHRTYTAEKDADPVQVVFLNNGFSQEDQDAFLVSLRAEIADWEASRQQQTIEIVVQVETNISVAEGDASSDDGSNIIIVIPGRDGPPYGPPDGRPRGPRCPDLDDCLDDINDDDDDD